MPGENSPPGIAFCLAGPFKTNRYFFSEAAKLSDCILELLMDNGRPYNHSGPGVLFFTICSAWNLVSAKLQAVTNTCWLFKNRRLPGVVVRAKPPATIVLSFICSNKYYLFGIIQKAGYLNRLFAILEGVNGHIRQPPIIHNCCFFSFKKFNPRILIH